MNLERVKSIADTVLYEGYILYPYRASAVKNQQRFNFGVLVPRSYSEGQGGSEAFLMRTDCVIEGDQPVIDVRVRFLHLVSRDVYKLLESTDGDVAARNSRFSFVPSLEVGDEVYHTWQEVVEREVAAENVCVRAVVSKPQQVEFTFDPSQAVETLYDAGSQAVGRLVRRQESIRGIITIRAESLGAGVARISIEIENSTSLETDCSTRDRTLMHSLVSTHTILSARDGEFVSLFDPGESFVETAAACRNVGTWPVLAGSEGERNIMLSSPIILYDYPQIAPESGGEFFDGTEIDELLALRVMTLTDEEKREMRDLDDRARQILERTESLPPEHWQKLHGAIRGLKTV